MGISRKEAEDRIVKLVGDIAPGTINVQLYKNLFTTMNDKEFKKFMENILSEKVKLQIVVEPSDTNALNTERNLKLAEKYGITMFQKLTYSEHGFKGDGTYVPEHTPVIPRLIIDVPMRRPSQLLTKGISVPKDNNSIDQLSGQVTGSSKSAKLTQPEIELLASMGLQKSVIEAIKARGGDAGMAAAFDMAIDRNGFVTLDQIEPYATGVVSSETLDIMFRSAMIDSNFSNKDKKVQ